MDSAVARREALGVEQGLLRALVSRLSVELVQRRCLRCLIATEIQAVVMGQCCAEVRLRRAEVLGQLLFGACR